MIESKAMLEIRKIRDANSKRHEKMTLSERQKESNELFARLEREFGISKKSC